MTYNEFVRLFNGKATDFDQGSGVQCVDLAKMYIYYVLGLKPVAIGNAEAYWRRYNELPYLHNNFEKIPNTPSFVPKKRRYSCMGQASWKVWTYSNSNRRGKYLLFLFL